MEFKTYCEYFLVEGTFQLNPVDRPTVNDLIDRLKEIAEARHTNLTAPLSLGQLNISSNATSPSM